MKVAIKDLCTCCGQCMQICPDIFEMGWDTVQVTIDKVPPELEEIVLQVSDECPLQAVVVE